MFARSWIYNLHLGYPGEKGITNFICNTYNVILYRAILLACIVMRVLGQGGARIDTSLRSHQLESSRRALGYYFI